MAIGTTAAITAGVGGAMGLGQTISGIIGKNKAQKALDNLEVPELTNAFEEISISTEGSDLIKEENQRTSAMLIDNARAGGVRSVMGSLPMIAAQNNNANREAQVYLDDQINRKQYAVANDERRIQGMNEQRYMGDVMGLNNMIQSNRQDIFSGIRGIGNSMMYAGRNMESSPGVDTSYFDNYPWPNFMNSF